MSTAAPGRATLALMIPVNLLMLPWLWIGRLVFGVFGWVAFLMLPVVLVVAVMLLTTTIIAYTQPTRPRRLTAAERTWQWVLWGALLAGGAFLPDFADTEDSYRSLLTQLFGYSDSLMNLSVLLVVLSAVVAIASWIGLLVSLLAGRKDGVPAPSPA